MWFWGPHETQYLCLIPVCQSCHIGKLGFTCSVHTHNPLIVNQAFGLPVAISQFKNGEKVMIVSKWVERQHLRVCRSSEFFNLLPFSLAVFICFCTMVFRVFLCSFFLFKSQMIHTLPHPLTYLNASTELPLLLNQSQKHFLRVAVELYALNGIWI